MKESVCVALFLAVFAAFMFFAFSQRAPEGSATHVQNNIYRFVDYDRRTVCWFAASRNGRATSVSCIPQKDL